MRPSIYRPNFFKPRKPFPPTADCPIKIHSSVKTRLEHYRDLKGRPYRNKAKWDPSLAEFVDEWALPKGGDASEPVSAPNYTEAQ